MAKQYLAKYRSRVTGIKLDYYKENGFIYRYLFVSGFFEGRLVVNSVPSMIKGFEEISLND